MVEEGESSRKRWTRRDWIKAGVMTGTAAAAGGAIGLVSYPLLFPAPKQLQGIIEDRIVYTRFPNYDTWWNGKAGETVRVTDFQLWQGATAVWRGLFDGGTYVAGSGYPVLVIRIASDDTYFHPPDAAPYGLPTGFDLFYDDPVRGIRIVVLFDRCSHLCCTPGWHRTDTETPLRDYTAFGVYPPDPPTYIVYGQDPVYCPCHGAQFDPLLLVSYVNPRTGAQFVGARVVHGPGDFGMPVVPVRGVGDDLVGGMADPRWYETFC